MMEYFRITGVDDYDNQINHKYIIEPEYSYADNLHFGIAEALNNRNICWGDFAEGFSFNAFNGLIDSGEKNVEIHGWAGKFTIELFVDEQDEYFSNLFKEHPHPWKIEYCISRCENGGAIDGIVDANGECVISSYLSYSAMEIMWKLYQYYVSKEGIKS